MMDTSNKYVKMCEAATEIQNMWKEHHWGDFVSYDSDSMVHALISVKDTYNNRNDYVWLPRQDQLQIMIEGYWYDNLDTLVEYSNAPCHDDPPAESMEQIWLMFVMEKKYSKTWNGDEWKEEKLR